MDKKDELVRLTLRERSVYLQGVAYVVSLPIEWVRNVGLKVGDRISPVVTQEGNLLLIPQREEDGDE